MGYEVVNGDGLAYRDWACGIGLFVASDVPPTSVDGVAFVEDDEYTLYNPSKEDATTVPDHLLRCPGLVDDITEHILRYRRYGYAPTSDAYKDAADRAGFRIPVVYWGKAADGGPSGLIGFSILGTDKETRGIIDADKHTFLRYTNADNTGYDVVVKVYLDEGNSILDGNAIQKQVEAYYAGLGLEVDNVYRKKDNPLLYSYDEDMACKPESTPYVPEVQYTIAIECCSDDTDSLAEDG